MRKVTSASSFYLRRPLTHATFSALAEPRPQAVQQLPSDNASLIRHFERTDPESLALARDWTDTAQSLVKTKENIAR